MAEASQAMGSVSFVGEVVCRWDLTRVLNRQNYRSSCICAQLYLRMMKFMSCENIDAKTKVCYIRHYQLLRFPDE